MNSNADTLAVIYKKKGYYSGNLSKTTTSSFQLAIGLFHFYSIKHTETVWNIIYRQQNPII